MKRNARETGQAVVVIAVSLLVLLGIAGLAVDGGMLYSDRRNAQNVADAAALAGAGQALVNLKNVGSDWSEHCSGAIEGAENSAIARAGSNGFYLTAQSSGDLAVSHQGVSVQCNQNPQSMDVSVAISTTTPAVFSSLLFGAPLRSQVQAVARVQAAQPVMPGNGLIAMEPNCSKNYNNVAISGGGTSGSVDVWSGGIFINTDGSQTCGLAPGTSNNSGTIIAHNGQITNVGTFDYNGNNKISPNPIQTNYNGGVSITDPMANLAEPTCSSAGTVDPQTGNYNPGSYGGPGELSLGNGGNLNPGIYCISGDLKYSGSQKLIGTNVLLYFKNGGLSFTGNGGLTITAPTSGPYAGIAIFSSRTNLSTIDVRGNGGQAVIGMIYALKGVVSAKGGGSTPGETDVTGQVIANQIINNGNGSLSVFYSNSDTYHSPASMSLYK